MIPRKVYLGHHKFRFLNEEHELASPEDWNRSEWGKLWLYNLHYFDCLRQEDLPEDEAMSLIHLWINENPPAQGNGWEPYPLSLRIVNWIKYYLSGHELSDEALQSLTVQCRALFSHLEKHLLANHYLANAKAMTFAGKFFQGKEARKWLKCGYRIYSKELPKQILPDGCHFERSPMYHSIILEDLLDLYNIHAPLPLKKYIPRMLHALMVLTGADGKIAFFNDAADGIALSPAQLLEYAKKLGFEIPALNGSFDLPDGGYARLRQGYWTLIADGGNIGPEYQPGHAHADTLSFELWDGETKILTNSGTGEYIATPNRMRQRSTAGHNALVLDHRNSSLVWAAHRVANRAHVTKRIFSDQTFAAAHDGYRPVVHERRWSLTRDKVAVADTLTGSGSHDVDIYWHFPPKTKLEIDNHLVRFSVDKNRYLLDFDESFEIELDATMPYSPEFGMFLPHPVVRCHIQCELPRTFTANLFSDTMNA